MSGDHNQFQKGQRWKLKKDGDDLIVCFDYTGNPKDQYHRFVRSEKQNNFECPRCGHCCQALVDETAKRKHIKTWSERCEEHPDHQTGMITERMIQERMQEEIDELRQALETKQEPVAWMHTTGTGHVYFRKKPQDKVFNPQPVYTAPPKREWVGLTDEEIQDLGYLYEKFDASNSEWFDRWGFARYIEAKLREKNHG